MLSVEQALAAILDKVSVRESETRPLLDSVGQVLAEDLIALENVPPHDNSAMDGYAVRVEDTRGASEATPVRLRVIANLAAGYVSPDRVEPGTCIRIMTGAPVPAGANAVVQFEHTDEGTTDSAGKAGQEVSIFREARPQLNVRRAAEDVAAGSTVLRAGHTVRPADVGVLASLGISQVRVVRRPRVGIVSTGDELVEIDQPLAPGKIRNSNSYSLAALVSAAGGVPVRLGIAQDTLHDVTAKLAGAASLDLLLTSGGVSVGDYDVVKDALRTEGEVTFWQVRMKPGKPLAFGHVRGVPLIGLPGNPVSAMVSFELFARPAILKMLGKEPAGRPRVRAVFRGSAINKDQRRHFLRVTVNPTSSGYEATVTGDQGSGVLTSMLIGNGLAIMPEDVKALKDGDIVDVLMLDWPEEVQFPGERP